VGGQVVEYYKQALRSLDSSMAKEQVPIQEQVPIKY
jgi:hypothetical protein